MACSAIYFLDNKGKVLINRNYRGDIEGNVIDKFIGGSEKYIYESFPIVQVFVGSGVYPGIFCLQDSCPTWRRRMTAVP